MVKSLKRNNDIVIGKEIKECLDKYTVNYPMDSDRGSVLYILKGYLPVNKRTSVFETMAAVLRLSLREVILSCRFQYLIMMLLLVFLLTMLKLSVSPYLTIFFTSPIPFFIGFRKLFQGNGNLMKELEKTFRFSYYQMLCGRIFSLTYISILLLFVPLGFFVLNKAAYESVSSLKLIVSGITPILVFSVYMLYIESMSRGENIFALSLILWVFFGFAAVSTPIGDIISELNVFVYIVIIVLSVVLFAINIMNVLRLQKKEFI